MLEPTRCPCCGGMTLHAGYGMAMRGPDIFSYSCRPCRLLVAGPVLGNLRRRVFDLLAEDGLKTRDEIAEAVELIMRADRQDRQLDYELNEGY